jgi:hypothetical protein
MDGNLGMNSNSISALTKVPSGAVAVNINLPSANILEDPEVQRLLDPSDPYFFEVMYWAEEKITLLMNAVPQPQTAVLIRKLMENGVLESSSELTYRNLSYSKDGVVRLHGITGYIKPGMLIGVIGAPDAGVTTFFNCLTGRTKGGRLSGDILLNGRSPDASFGRKIGYVVKDDPNLAMLTVFETLYFSSKCRLPQIPDRIIKLRLAGIMRSLGLAHVGNTIVGSAIIRG